MSLIIHTHTHTLTHDYAKLILPETVHIKFHSAVAVQKDKRSVVLHRISRKGFDPNPNPLIVFDVGPLQLFHEWHLFSFSLWLSKTISGYKSARDD